MISDRFARRCGAAIQALAVALSVLPLACAPSIAASIDDAAISARVKTVLLNDAEINALNIDVQTVSGVVTISGVVRTSEEERRAVDLARGVEGVRDVRSTLRISSSGG